MEKSAAASLLRAALDLHMIICGAAATRRKISEVFFPETIVSSSSQDNSSFVEVMGTSSFCESGSWKRFDGKWGDLSDDE
jgi:hypothetical protein